MTRERPTEPHERNRAPNEPQAWLREAAVSVAADLRAFAAKYPDRFEFRDGKLTTKKNRG